MRYSLLALFAALLAFAPSASAAPVKVKPVVSVTAATTVGKNVKFTIAVTVANVPKCKGKVTATHKVSKKKRVSWSARYTGDSAICTAAIHGKLPAKNFGKKIKFSIKFPGNDFIKKFSASKSLTLTPPPAPPTGGTTIPIVLGPQKPGPWNMLAVDGSAGDMTFRIGADHKVPALLHPSNLSMTCENGKAQLPFNWSNTFFSMGAQIGAVTSGDSGLSMVNMIYTLTWNFTDAHSGTGHFSASGGFVFASGQPATHCETSYNVTFSGGNP